MEALRDLFLTENGGLSFTGKILAIVIIILVAMLIMRVVRELLKRFNKKQMANISVGKTKTINNVLYSIIRVVVYFIAITLILDMFGINTSSIIAAAGIGGVAIAFGAQSIVSDVISGFFLLIDNEFQVGDYVILDKDYAGTITTINLRRTLIEAYSGAVYSIPNSEIKVIANHERNNIQADVKIAVPYRIPISEIKEIIEYVAEVSKQEYSDLYVEPAYFIGVDDMTDLTYTVTVGAVTKPGDQWRGARILRELILSELENREFYLDIEVEEDDEQI